MELTCPKCQGSMRTYERNDVHVDQCTDCRGIFLDRGELERLVAAENAWHGDAGPAARQSQERPSGGRGSDLGSVVGDVLHQVKGQQRGHSGQHYDDRYGSHGYPRKRKKSFLDELFD